MNDVRFPGALRGREFSFDEFDNGKVLFNKKKNRLPAMGWNSWNAFGSGNTEELTKIMADRIVELGLDKLGYRYVVLDDGCYKPERENGMLANEPGKFPSGFRPLADYIHGKGLKFGMYNDIGTNLCAGAAVGTFDHEKSDAREYLNWGVDFIKVDNCYYMWDNATFSDPENARFVYTPRIRAIYIRKKSADGEEKKLSVADDGYVSGEGVAITKTENDCFAENIGTFDGTNTGTTPVGIRSGELRFDVNVDEDDVYVVKVEYATGRQPAANKPGVGGWLQIAVNSEENGTAGSKLYFDEMLSETPSMDDFTISEAVEISLSKGKNTIRLMNHRRQENTLNSYAALLEGFNEADPDNDIVLSICEWGKTQPQNWGYKTGDSWRILNDITFWVGRDGNPGIGRWYDPGTPSITSQYNKAVVMYEFAGLDKGWNDPDMMVIGMNGITDVMCRTHMVMWCMMNSPLMLGLDLRRVQKDDWIYRIIANEDLIALDQDVLGIQARRIWTSIESDHPDKDYITNNDRVDILAKPLADGSAAVSFINISERRRDEGWEISVDDIPFESFKRGNKYQVTDLWTKDVTINENGRFRVESLDACDNLTIRIKAL